MARRIEIERLSTSELQDFIKEAVERATSPLKSEVERLEKRLHEQRAVITQAEAPRYFGDKVGEQRVREYCRGKDLPEGVDVALPARKQGNLYFIEVETLQRWQLGQCTEEDLFPWQRREA